MTNKDHNLPEILDQKMKLKLQLYTFKAGKVFTLYLQKHYKYRHIEGEESDTVYLKGEKENRPVPGHR